MGSSGELQYLQSLPLKLKIAKSKQRIREWYYYFGGEVYISFSGGKDSTVLLDLVRSEFPDVPAVFIDTGLEFPEIRDFVRTIDNVVWVKPKMDFKCNRKIRIPCNIKRTGTIYSKLQNN